MLDDIKQHMPDMLQLCLALHAFQLVRVQTVLCWDNVHSSDSSREHSFLFAVPSTCLEVTVYQPGPFIDARGEKTKKHTQIFVLILVAVTLNCWHVNQEAHPPKSTVIYSWLLVQGGGRLRCKIKSWSILDIIKRHSLISISSPVV